MLSHPLHKPIKQSTKTTQSGKMTQVPMFTFKGCDIGRGDARRVVKQEFGATQKLSSVKKIASQLADESVLFCFSPQTQ